MGASHIRPQTQTKKASIAQATTFPPQSPDLPSREPVPPESASPDSASPDSASPDSASPEPASPKPASSELKKNSNQSRKRIGRSLRAPRSRLKQLRPYLNEDYRILFNDTVNLVNGETSLESFGRITPSQIGITLWSSGEKLLFFDTVAKKGRNDLPGIAAAIGTKTELEVHVYLQLLQKYVVKQHLEGRSRQLFDTSQVPGALEVSQTCDAELELAADALSAKQEQEDHRLEIKKHKEIWLLDTNIARWVEHCRHDGEKGENEIRTRMPAAALLNLDNFLRLSRSIFMNSSMIENNWRHYRTKPSILYTAFSDFHMLAISIIKRLIQSTIFFALSRHRAASAQKYEPRKTVRRQDVVAALNVLGMSHNVRKYWVGAARRCRLTVYGSADSETFTNEHLTYENIEMALSRGFDRGEMHPDVATRKDDDHAAVSRAVMLPRLSAEDSFNQDPSDDRSDSSISSTTPNGSLLSALRNNSRLPSNQETQDDNDEDDQSDHEEEGDEDDADEDAYAEALDKKASQFEEQGLWRLFCREPPDSIKPEELKIPKAPHKKRKVDEDLDDWRSWVDYVPEWEAYETPISVKEFTKNRKTWKKRKTASSPAQREIQAEHIHQYSGSGNETSAEEETATNSSDDEIEHEIENLESNPDPNSSSDALSEDDGRLGIAQEPEDVSENTNEEKSESGYNSGDSMEEGGSE